MKENIGESKGKKILSLLIVVAISIVLSLNLYPTFIYLSPEKINYINVGISSALIAGLTFASKREQSSKRVKLFLFIVSIFCILKMPGKFRGDMKLNISLIAILFMSLHYGASALIGEIFSEKTFLRKLIKLFIFLFILMYYMGVNLNSSMRDALYITGVLFLIKSRRIGIKNISILALVIIFTQYLSMRVFNTSEFAMKPIILMMSALIIVPALELQDSERKNLYRSIVSAATIPMIISVTKIDPNAGFFSFDYGAMIYSTFLMALALTIGDNGNIFSRVFYSSFSLVAMYSVFLTERRSALVSMIFIIPLMLLFSIKKKIYLVSMFLILGVLSLTILQYNPEIKSRALSITDTKVNPSNTIRIGLWKMVPIVVKNHPIIGIGENNLHKELVKDTYSGYNRDFLNIARVYGNVLIHAHNNIMERFVAGGIIGGILYLLLQFSILKNLILTWRKSSEKAIYIGIIFSLLGMEVFGFFEDIAFRPQGYIWWIVIAMGLTKQIKENENRL